MFDYAIWSRTEAQRPLLLVCEEAHRYVPKDDSGKAELLELLATRLPIYAELLEISAVDVASVQADAAAFLAQLEKVMPGASAMASRDENGQLVAHVESWSHNPLAKGSYPCNRPGYFTTLAHNEGKAVGNLLFAGDHTSSIYEWQGFMEGAALSGLRAAAEVHALAQA